MSQQFHISDILSVYTGVLVSRADLPGRTSRVAGLYEVMNYMSGESLQTLALSRVADEVHPYLEQQFPWLKTVKVPKFTQMSLNGQDAINAAVDAWTSGMAAQHGEYLTVIPMFEGDHEVLDPLEDLQRIDPTKTASDIIPIDLTDEEPPSPTGDINWKVD